MLAGMAPWPISGLDCTDAMLVADWWCCCGARKATYIKDLEASNTIAARAGASLDARDENSETVADGM
jgi:hypothetical protein